MSFLYLSAHVKNAVYDDALNGLSFPVLDNSFSSFSLPFMPVKFMKLQGLQLNLFFAL